VCSVFRVVGAAGRGTLESEEWSMARRKALITVLVLAGLLVPSAVQSAASSKFEVAAIKPCKSGDVASALASRAARHRDRNRLPHVPRYRDHNVFEKWRAARNSAADGQP